MRKWNGTIKIVCCMLLPWSIYSCASNVKDNSNNILTDAPQYFTIDNIVNTAGLKIKLDFSRSDLTLIDIWNNNCPPCIEEMQQFPALIKGKESKISVYSLSITQFWLWQKTMREHEAPFGFLVSGLSNWKQYNLMTTDNPELKNPIAVDRLVELERWYKINGNPAYFVVDRTGKIVSRPVSAVQFLKELKL